MNCVTYQRLNDLPSVTLAAEDQAVEYIQKSQHEQSSKNQNESAVFLKALHGAA